MASWFELALGATVLFALMAIAVTKTVGVTTPAKTLFYLFAIGAVLLFGYLVWSGDGISIPSSVWVLVGAAAVLSVLGNLAVFTALQTAPNPGYVTAVTTASIALVTILAVFLLGSPLSPVGIAGIGLILAGAAALAFA